MVRLYIARVRDIDPPDYLSLYRKGRLQSLRTPSSRTESLCSELLLIKALQHEGREFSLPLDIMIVGRGKPEINGADFHISLSHSGGYVLCAIAEQTVGADIEAARTPDLRIAERFFSEDERAEAVTADGFLQIWVQKESYIKSSGLGLAQDFRSFSVFDQPEKYFYCKHTDLHIAAYSPSGECISGEITELEI